MNWFNKHLAGSRDLNWIRRKITIAHKTYANKLFANKFEVERRLKHTHTHTNAVVPFSSYSRGYLFTSPDCFTSPTTCYSNRVWDEPRRICWKNNAKIQNQQTPKLNTKFNFHLWTKRNWKIVFWFYPQGIVWVVSHRRLLNGRNSGEVFSQPSRRRS